MIGKKLKSSRSTSELADSALDRLWQTIDLNESPEDEAQLNTTQPTKTSFLDKAKKFIEEYIPGGRLILYSVLKPMAHANLDVADCWLAQLCSFLPQKPTLSFLDSAKIEALPKRSTLHHQKTSQTSSSHLEKDSPSKAQILLKP